MNLYGEMDEKGTSWNAVGPTHISNELFLGLWEQVAVRPPNLDMLEGGGWMAGFLIYVFGRKYMTDHERSKWII